MGIYKQMTYLLRVAVCICISRVLLGVDSDFDGRGGRWWVTADGAPQEVSRPEARSEKKNNHQNLRIWRSFPDRETSKLCTVKIQLLKPPQIQIHCQNHSGRISVWTFPVSAGSCLSTALWKWAQRNIIFVTVASANCPHSDWAGFSVRCPPCDTYCPLEQISIGTSLITVITVDICVAADVSFKVFVYNLNKRCLGAICESGLTLVFCFMSWLLLHWVWPKLWCLY